eukprot:1649156-Ditylum_brightwellii.AAC.1
MERTGGKPAHKQRIGGGNVAGRGTAMEVADAELTSKDSRPTDNKSHGHRNGLQPSQSHMDNGKKSGYGTRGLQQGRES